MTSDVTWDNKGQNSPNGNKGYVCNCYLLLPLTSPPAMCQMSPTGTTHRHHQAGPSAYWEMSLDPWSFCLSLIPSDTIIPLLRTDLPKIVDSTVLAYSNLHKSITNDSIRERMVVFIFKASLVLTSIKFQIKSITWQPTTEYCDSWSVS